MCASAHEVTLQTGQNSLCKAGIYAHDLVIRLIQQAANLTVPLQHVPWHLSQQWQLSINSVSRSFELCTYSCIVDCVNTVFSHTLSGGECI